VRAHAPIAVTQNRCSISQDHAIVGRTHFNHAHANANADLVNLIEVDDAALTALDVLPTLGVELRLHVLACVASLRAPSASGAAENSLQLSYACSPASLLRDM